ncbi:hypothetical protein [Pelistega suis]|uniref:Uncharacterized protein n=1 Tax=Pelistega suis TaxID=1631957 RepID=A0A849P7N6_9BURK|nr:hypothetical protein [Pelistega suis]NOL52591.1 hypothetical protein [Pelistega suis]
MMICNDPCYYEDNGMGGMDFFFLVEKIGLYQGKLVGSLNIVSDDVIHPGNHILLDLITTIGKLKSVVANLKEETIPDIGHLSVYDEEECKYRFVFDEGREYETGIIDLSFDGLALYLGYDGDFERVFMCQETLFGMGGVDSIIEKRLRKGTLKRLILKLPDFDTNDEELQEIVYK